MEQELIKIEKFLKEIIFENGKKVKKNYLENNNKIICQKEANDYLTTLDITSEDYLINKTIKRFPNYNILSEEKNFLNNNSEFTFVFDPLDGTKEFMRGISEFNIIGGLQYKGKMVIGVVYRVIDDELYFSRKNNGSYLNDKRIHVSSVSKLSDSYIYAIFPTSNLENKLAKKMWQKFYLLSRKTYRIKGMGRISSALCYVAKGSFDGFWNPLGVTKGLWDILPSLIILEEAGGRISDINGEVFNNDKLDRGIVISNNILHEDLLSILQ